MKISHLVLSSFSIERPDTQISNSKPVYGNRTVMNIGSPGTQTANRPKRHTSIATGPEHSRLEHIWDFFLFASTQDQPEIPNMLSTQSHKMPCF